MPTAERPTSVKSAWAFLLEAAIYHHTRSGIEEVGGVDSGLAECFRDFRVTLYDNPQIPMGEMREIWPEGKPEAAGLLRHLCQRQKRCLIFVHPDQGDRTLSLLTLAGCEVDDRRHFADRANGSTGTPAIFTTAAMGNKVP